MYLAIVFVTNLVLPAVRDHTTMLLFPHVNYPDYLSLPETVQSVHSLAAMLRNWSAIRKYVEIAPSGVWNINTT